MDIKNYLSQEVVADLRPLNIHYMCTLLLLCRQYKSIAYFLFFLSVNDQIHLFLKERWMIAETLWAHVMHVFGGLYWAYQDATCFWAPHLLCLGTAPRHILDKPKGNE
jgi:hypothetical protein